MQQQSVPSLKKSCLVTLIKCRRLLGDVGYMDVDSLRGVLYHCSVDELRCIEDMTLKGSNRDLSWYTWDYWLEHYRKKFGSSRATQAPPLPEDAPEDYMPPTEAEAAADWRRAYEERKAADAAVLNRLGQQTKAMYQQAEAERVSKQAQVCSKVQGDKVRRRSAPTMLGAKRPPPPATPADRHKSKVLKSIGLIAPSSRAAPPGSRKVTITRTLTPQPPRTLTPQPPRAAPHAGPPHPSRLNPTTAARLASHSKASISASYLPAGTTPPRTARPQDLPTKSSPAFPPQRPPPTTAAPSSRPSPSSPPSKGLQPSPSPSTRLAAPSTRLPATTSSKVAGHNPAAAGRPPSTALAGSRPVSGSTAKPGSSDLSRMSDAQLEAELARRRQQSSVPGLRIMDEDDY